MATLTVGPNSTFRSIQDAMISGGPGDVILLESGYSGETASVLYTGMTISGDASSTGIVLNLASGVTSVTLGGTAPINVFDGSDGNMITGNDGDNVVQVSGGADAVSGGLGQDRLIVDYSLATGAISGDSLSNFAEAGSGGRLVTINGGFEDFTVLTGSGADTITVADGTNVVRVGDGANTVTAGNGVNLIVGGNDADTIVAGDGGNRVEAGNGANTITTGGGADVIFAGNGKDSITSGAGDDLITITGGQDTIVAGAGTDLLTVDYSAAVTAVTGGVVSGDLAGGYVGSIADLTAAKADFIGVENFRITTGTGNDSVTTGDGTDYIAGGAGSDVLFGGGGDDMLFGNQDNDTLYGNAGNDQLFGGQGDDTLFGGQGDDVLHGNLGNDYLEGGKGINQVYGDGGSDTAGYISAAAGVTVTLVGQGIAGSAAVAQATGVSTDSLNDIANLTGSGFADTLTGDANANVLTGGIGTDTLFGGDGNDTLFGNQDNDTLNGGFGTDTLYGGQGDDMVYGNQGDDQLFGNIGNDTLYGGQGNDMRDGGAGNDILVGGLGSNMLTGGDGADSFVANASAQDSILDFSQAAGDRIDLRSVDAVQGNANALDRFSLVDSFSGQAGQLTVSAAADAGHYVVQGDTNSDGAADFAIDVFGAAAAPNQDAFLFA